ncbi:MAG: Ig-like domain-containing protein [Trueperaceae bacterium]|nr:MAG: Ig-like domain-containing protein [Trueperaceae bacterium]
MHASRSNRSIDPGYRPRHRAVLHAVAFALAALLVAACGAPGNGGAPAGSLTIAPASLELGIGADETLVASLDGTPTTNVTWASLDGAVASVDTAGVVTGVAAGSTSITATSSGGATAEASVTVVACSAPTEIDSDVTVPTTWTAQGFGCTDYVVLSPIDVTDSLTVEAGTVVRFAEEAGLRVTSSSGSLDASGSAAAVVRFAGTQTTAGWWRGIEMWRTGSTNSSSLDHVRIEHAGYTDPTDPDDPAISLQLGRPGTTDVSDVNVIAITNTTIRDGAGFGLYATRFSTVSAFAGNTITGHGDAPVRMSARNSGFLDGASVLTGNTNDYVQIDGDEQVGTTGQINTITEPITWTRLASDVPYRFDGAARVEAELTVAPGVTVEFVADGELRVTDGGSIVADGTSAEPIIFTGTESVPGHWNGIIIWRTDEDSHSVLDHVTIEYAGGEPDVPDFAVYGYNLVLGSPTTDTSANALLTTLTNTTLRHGSGYGLYISHGSTFAASGFANNTLTANAEGAAHVSAQAARWLDDGTSYAGNDDDHVLLDATDSPTDNVLDDATWPALGDGVRYLVDGVIDLRAVVTIAPGVTLSFLEDTGIFAQHEDAGIVADGTSASPIVLTGETPVGGSWYGVYLRQARLAGNVMDHVTIAYGGGEFDGGVTGWVDSGRTFNLSVGQNPINEVAQMLVTNSTFSDAGVAGSGSGYGLYVSPGSMVNLDACSANTFTNTQQGCLIDD